MVYEPCSSRAGPLHQMGEARFRKHLCFGDERGAVVERPLPMPVERQPVLPNARPLKVSPDRCRSRDTENLPPFSPRLDRVTRLGQSSVDGLPIGDEGAKLARLRPRGDRDAPQSSQPSWGVECRHHETATLAPQNPQYHTDARSIAKARPSVPTSLLRRQFEARPPG